MALTGRGILSTINTMVSKIKERGRQVLAIHKNVILLYFQALKKSSDTSEITGMRELNCCTKAAFKTSFLFSDHHF